MMIGIDRDERVKLIISRKGFDSSAGGVPSPLVDDRPISLPIPTQMPTPTRYGDLSTGIVELVSDLTRGRVAADHPCHLDPDLDARFLVRLPDWRGALGQVAAAQSHLSNRQLREIYVAILADNELADARLLFREHYQAPADRVPDMKVLDFIFWSLGKLSDEEE